MRLKLQRCQLHNIDDGCMWGVVNGLALRFLDLRENNLSLDQVKSLARVARIANESRYFFCKKLTFIKVLVSVNDFSEDSCEQITTIHVKSLIGRSKIVMTMEIQPASVP